jgi:hypothetical protein
MGSSKKKPRTRLG